MRLAETNGAPVRPLSYALTAVTAAALALSGSAFADSWGIVSQETKLTQSDEPETNSGDALAQGAALIRTIDMVVAHEAAKSWGRDMAKFDPREELPAATRVSAVVSQDRAGGKPRLEGFEVASLDAWASDPVGVRRISRQSDGSLKVEVEGISDLKLTHFSETEDGGFALRLEGLPPVRVSKDGTVRIGDEVIGQVAGKAPLPGWPPSKDQLIPAGTAGSRDLGRYSWDLNWEAGRAGKTKTKGILGVLAGLQSETKSTAGEAGQEGSSGSSKPGAPEASQGETPSAAEAFPLAGENPDDPRAVPARRPSPQLNMPLGRGGSAGSGGAGSGYQGAPVQHSAAQSGPGIGAAALTNDPDAEAAFAHYKRLAEAQGGRLAEEPGQRTVIGLRGVSPSGVVQSESSRPVRAYNCTFVVLWKDRAGKAHVHRFLGGTTPGQATTGFSGTPDVDRNGSKDIAHLAPGSFPFRSRLFKGRSAYGSGQALPVYRDLSHDGRISEAEKQFARSRGLSARGILFHRGNASRPSSVGCQTMSSAEFARFEAALGGDRSWDYVLIDPR